MLINNELLLMEIINKYKKKYIYGAGKNAKLLIDRFEYHSVKFDGICVSEKYKEGEKYYIINEVPRDAIIIIAASEINRKEMIEECIRLGFLNYIEISNKLILTMKRLNERQLRFQIHIVEHCNLKCRGCYHFSPLAKEEYLSVEEFEKDIKRLSKLFNGEMDEIKLLGGEPLLHPQIEDFIKICRKYFHKGSIRILTNGLKLLDMSNSFYELLRENNVEIWVTKYPVKFDYSSAEKKAYKFGVFLKYFNTEPVRTLGHQPLDLEGKRDYKYNFYNCYRANQCIDLKHGRLYPCIIPAEIKPFCEYFGKDIAVVDNDFVNIYDVHSADEILNAMEKPIPFCRYCNRDDVKVFGAYPWSVTKYDIREWTE